MNFATGHAHAIADAGAELLTGDVEERFLRIVSDFAILTHEEHAPITLPRGAYLVVRQREYTPDAPDAPRPVARTGATYCASRPPWLPLMKPSPGSSARGPTPTVLAPRPEAASSPARSQPTHSSP
jgi:hypothetical protein